MKKAKTLKCFHFRYLLLCIPILIYGCEKLEDEHQHNHTGERLRIISLDQVPKLKPMMQNLKEITPKGADLSRGGETYKGVDHVLTDEIIEVTNSEGKLSYTFGIDTDFKNTNVIENLHMIQTTEGYIAYIMRYEPNENWRYDASNFTPEGDLVVDLQTFQGNITKFTLEREVIWTTLPPPPGFTGLGWIEECTYSVVQFCTNDGHGGSDGDPHVRGDACVDGPFFNQLTSNCIMVYVGTGSSADTSNPEHPTSGANLNEEEEEDCIPVRGTLILNNQPLSGISTSCIKAPVVAVKQPKFEEDCDTSKEDLKKVFPAASNSDMELLANVINSYGKDFGINTKEKLQHFLAQAGHEVGGFQNGISIEESLNYSTTSRLLKVFPKYFSLTDPSKRNPAPYVNNPVGLANYVYGQRMSNQGEASGDGYKFRGRGIFQITGRANYTSFNSWYNSKHDIDIDLLNSPQLIKEDKTLSILSALWFYKRFILNQIGNDDNLTVEKVTKKVNGHKNGLDDRKIHFSKAQNFINCK